MGPAPRAFAGTDRTVVAETVGVGRQAAQGRRTDCAGGSRELVGRCAATRRLCTVDFRMSIWTIFVKIRECVAGICGSGDACVGGGL